MDQPDSLELCTAPFFYILEAVVNETRIKEIQGNEIKNKRIVKRVAQGTK